MQPLPGGNHHHPPCKICRGGAENAGGGCRKCTPAKSAGVNAIRPAQGLHPCKVCTPCRKCTPAKSAAPPCKLCTRNRNRTRRLYESSKRQRLCRRNSNSL